MLLKIYKKIAGVLGFKLIDKNLIKNDRELSKHAFYSLDKMLENIFAKQNIKTLVQIGSNDGVRFDSLNKFIKKYFPKAILIEPIKNNFIDLKKNYKDQKNVFFENSAISVNNEIQILFKVKKSKLHLYDEHIVGITSFDINHLIKHGVSKNHIEQEKVESISIVNLLKKYSIINFDLLFIDTEGYDANIVSDFLNNSEIRPIISFEYIHTNFENLKKTLELLKNKKYILFKIEENIFCLPEENKDQIKIF